MKRVLIVEDDQDLAELLCLALGDRYEVQTALDGHEGLMRLSARAFDVAVVDLVMPRLDGASMLGEMRRRSMMVPVIISSGTPELDEVAVRTRASSILWKPYDVGELIAAIEAATETRTRVDDGAATGGDRGSAPS